MPNNNFIFELFLKLFDTAVGTIIIISCYLVYYVTNFVMNCIEAGMFIMNDNFTLCLVSLAVLIGSIITVITKSKQKLNQ